MRTFKVSKSKLLDDGLCVWFKDNLGDDEAYYAHGIHKIGERTDADASDSMWGWVNHMSHKVWWNSDLEGDFVREVKKYYE